MGIDTKQRVVDFRAEDNSFKIAGIDHGSRIKRLFRRGLYEVWMIPGHKYRWGIGLIDYAPSEYRLVRVWLQEFDFMDEPGILKELAGDNILTIEPGRYWQAALTELKMMASELARFESVGVEVWPLKPDILRRMQDRLRHLMPNAEVA